MSFFDRMKIAVKNMSNFEKEWNSEPPKRQPDGAWRDEAGSLNNSPQMPGERQYMDPRFMRVQKQKKARAQKNLGSDSASTGVKLVQESPLKGFGEVFKNYKHGETCKCEGCVQKYAGKKY